MISLIYLLWWFLKVRLLRIRKPIQTVLFISNQCNLTCRHCTIHQLHHPQIKTYEKIKEELKYSYSLGSRFVDFEGGEPTIWKDGNHRLNDLICLATHIGFYSVTVTTNAQIPFPNLDANFIWISLDGIGKFHDEIRGKGTFDLILQNIATSNHKKISINMVINSINYESVEDTIEFAKNHSKIQSISLNFYTPYSEGIEDQLFLDWDKRIQVIDLILRKKKNGYPIINSNSGLKLMKQNIFKKYCWISNFILPNGDRLTECQGKSKNICHLCGLSMAGEMNAVFNFKADTILAGIKLRL